MKYLNSSFSVPALKAEDWERIFGEEYCTCEEYEISPYPTSDCYCQKCSRVIPEERLP